MAGFIPSFLNGSKVAIRIGTKVIAFAQNVSISDDMQVQPVGGIGSYSYQSLEPTGYMARGSLTLTHYSNLVLNALNANSHNIPASLQTVAADAASNSAADGNSLLMAEFFSPARLLLSRSVDLDFYERQPSAIDTIQDFGFAGADGTGISPIYRLQNVRFTNYSIGFTPGSLVQESYQFLATGLLDSRAGEIEKFFG